MIMISINDEVDENFLFLISYMSQDMYDPFMLLNIEF